MRAAWTTSEFWATIIAQLMAVAVTLNLFTPEQGGAIGNATTTIAGGLISLGAALGYLRSTAKVRTELVGTLAVSSVRPAAATPEFWIALVPQVLGVLVVLGIIGADKATELTSAMTTLSGGVIALLGTVGFLASRGDEKKVVVQTLTHSVGSMSGSTVTAGSLERAGL